jgi:hypothetical protein
MRYGTACFYSPLQHTADYTSYLNLFKNPLSSALLSILPQGMHCLHSNSVREQNEMAGEQQRNEKRY